MKNPLKNTEPIKEKKSFWEDEGWRKKELKKMERNKKVAEKRRGESELRKFEAWRTSGYRTY